MFCNPVNSELYIFFLALTGLQKIIKFAFHSQKNCIKHALVASNLHLICFIWNFVYFQAQMVRRVKAYLAQKPVIYNEDELMQMSQKCEPDSQSSHKPMTSYQSTTSIASTVSIIISNYLNLHQVWSNLLILHQIRSNLRILRQMLLVFSRNLNFHQICPSHINLHQICINSIKFASNQSN